MTRQDLLALCLRHPGAYLDHPFHDDNWACVRHGAGGHIFAAVYERHGRLRLNLKCEPMRADFYRQIYSGVAPGYHMNHQHWNTVTPGEDVPLAELQEMIRHSHELTSPKKRSAAKNPQKT